MRKQTWTRLVAFLLVLVTLNGCSGASTPDTENTTTPSSSEPATLDQAAPNVSEHEHNYIAGEAIAPTCTADGDDLINSQGGINTDEKFQQHQVLVRKLIEILSLYVPEMLKEEPFYNDVFYNHINSETVFDWLDSMINVA